jgi:hypothetical protein
MNPNVTFYVTLYVMMAAIVAVILVGSMISRPPLSRREKVELFAAALLWPAFMLFGLIAIVRDLSKYIRNKIAVIVYKAPPR